MTPNYVFLKQPKAFWAYVRSIGQAVGYTVRGEGQIKVPAVEEMANALNGLGLDGTRLLKPDGATKIA